MVSVINNFGGFYSRELYFHELKKTGARHSRALPKPKRLPDIDIRKTVFMGFIHIQGLEEQLMKEVIENRNGLGAFLHLADFIDRINHQALNN